MLRRGGVGCGGLGRSAGECVTRPRSRGGHPSMSASQALFFCTHTWPCVESSACRAHPPSRPWRPCSPAPSPKQRTTLQYHGLRAVHLHDLGQDGPEQGLVGLVGDAVPQRHVQRVVLALAWGMMGGRGRGEHGVARKPDGGVFATGPGPCMPFTSAGLQNLQATRRAFFSAANVQAPGTPLDPVTAHSHRRAPSPLPFPPDSLSGLIPTPLLPAPPPHHAPRSPRRRCLGRSRPQTCGRTGSSRGPWSGRPPPRRRRGAHRCPRTTPWT